MADRMAVMDQGNVIQVGPPEEVYRNPNCSYVAGFIGETNLLKGTFTGDGAVETSSGILKGRITVAEWSPSAGTEVLLSIRPEAIKIGPPAGANLTGKIRERTYLGNLIQYAVELADGAQMQVTEMNPRTIYEPGEEAVGLSMTQDDTLILKD